MNDIIHLGDAGSSLIALVLIAIISATTLILLPRRDRASQLFWILPCIALAVFEALTDSVRLSPAQELAASFATTLVLATTLARRALSSLGRQVSPPMALALCAGFSALAGVAATAGLARGSGTAVSIVAIIAACCWPMLTPRLFACLREHPDRVLPFMLLLAYGLLILAPGVEAPETGAAARQLESLFPFLAVVIGFVASSVALRRAFRENERLIAAEQAARAAREETAQLLGAVIETTPAAVYVKDLEGRYRLVNRLAAAWYGRSEQEMIGRSDFDLLPVGVAREMREHDDLVLATGKQHSRDLELPRLREADERPIASHKFPLFDAAGRVHLVAGLAVDMTDSKRHERELEAARFKAEEANCAKSNFLAHMSHELRTPLNAIIGFSEIIQSAALGPVGNELYKQYAADIQMAGQLLLTHVDDLLDISQIDTSELEISLQSLNLGMMAAECRTLLHGPAERKGIRIEIDAGRALPQIRADLRATMQVLVNLVGNAVKYLPSGSTITIAGGRTESGAPYLLIEDNGPERSAEDLQALLDPWTLRPATRAEEGRGGMGLLLARKLMEAQGGRLVVDRSSNSGTRIVCQFAGDPQAKVAGRALA